MASGSSEHQITVRQKRIIANTVLKVNQGYRFSFLKAFAVLILSHGLKAAEVKIP